MTNIIGNGLNTGVKLFRSAISRTPISSEYPVKTIAKDYEKERQERLNAARVIGAVVLNEHTRSGESYQPYLLDFRQYMFDYELRLEEVGFPETAHEALKYMFDDLEIKLDQKKLEI